MRPKQSAFFLAACVLFLLAMILPYQQAARLGGEGYVFGGFLLNPLDGSSYLAKMQAGYDGAWSFRLPYTAEPGAGSALFLFYLFLGHAARWSGLPLVTVFHLARLLSAALMLVALWRFCRQALPERLSNWGFALAAFGSGLGWLALGFGLTPIDLWVAEIYPFLSAYVNPHFPFGLALLLFLLGEALENAAGRSSTPRQAAFVAAAALLLAVVSPFGVILAGLITAALVVLQTSGLPVTPVPQGSGLPVTPVPQGSGLPVTDFLPRAWHNAWRSPLPWIALGGLPLLIYDLWIVRVHPVLSGWDAQNLTPAPSLGLLLLGLSPALPLAVLGVRQALQERPHAARLLLAWAGLGLLLLYLPLGLQRRFLFGLYAPLSLLAAWGMAALAAKLRRPLFMTASLALLLALPVNLLLLLAGAQAGQSHDARQYLARGEAQALEWLGAHTAPDALVLASPRTGMFIPPVTGRRVIYGHPYETVPAQAEEAVVTAFFADLDPTARLAFALERGVDYVFWGPQEADLAGQPSPLAGPAPAEAHAAQSALDAPPAWREVYRSAGVTIYAVDGE